MSDRGWNKCDLCGKFRKPEQMEFGESRSLDLYGGLIETYWQECKDGFGCLAALEVEK